MKQPEFDSSWSDEVKHVYDHDMREIWDNSIATHIFNMYQSQLQRLKAFVPNESCRILDVGCAQATLAMQLAETGHKVTAMDLRQDFLDYAATRWTQGDIKFVCGNVLDIDPDTLPDKYDIIFANQIIEHLVYPLEMVSALKQLLTPKGRLVITTPNGKYLKNTLPTFTELGDPKQWEEKQFTADGDGHFFAYLDTELESIFQQAGLQSIHCESYETPWISGHMKFRYLHKVLPFSTLNTLDKTFLTLPFNKAISHQLLISGCHP